MSIMRWVGTSIALMALCACSESVDRTPPLETVVAAPLALQVRTQGELRAAKSTPLTVPGSQWARRQLLWMLPEGSRVKQGEVIARFGAPQAQLDLKDARANLLRNALARQGKQAELQTGSARIDADLAQVDTDLGIASRYADADLDFFARNELLDAVQDQAFLGAKKGYLGWKRDQTGERGAAELAVLDSQRAGQQQTAKTREEDLAALELTAPHDGVFMLSTDWSGDKPRIGAAVWAGNDFGTLPDASALEVQFALTQIDAAGVKVGAQVELYPLGRPDQVFTSEVSWVAAAAQAISRKNPIKYLRMRSQVDAARAAELGLVPGQSLVARVYALRAEEGISIPNIALISDGGDSVVEVWQQGERVRRPVQLGERGVARTQVLEGLNPGDVVVLTRASEPAA